MAQDSRAIDIALTAKLLAPNTFSLICALHNQANVRIGDSENGELRKQQRFQRIARRADALLAVSPGLLEGAYRRLSPGFDRGVVIANPAYRREAAEAAIARPRRHPIRGEPHIVFVGRLARQKSLPTLLNALAILANVYGRPAQLSLIGEGPCQQALQSRAETLGIQNRIRFLGFVPDPMNYMAGADVFVLPSEQEAFGYVLVEALAVGLPIVSTDCPYGPRYILEDGKYGSLVPVGDAESMAAAIAETLDAPRQPERLIARARDFDSHEIARRYAHLFERLIAERRAGG